MYDTGLFKGIIYISKDGSGLGGGFFIYNAIGDSPAWESCTSDFGHAGSSTFQLYRPEAYSTLTLKNNDTTSHQFTIFHGGR